MKETVLAKRYAKALFEIAEERDILETIRSEVDNFNENLETNPDFRQYLYSQDISQSEKKSKFENLFQDKVSNVFFNFVQVILGKSREILFPIVAREFEVLLARKEKRLPATATTAVPLDAAAKEKLKKMLDETFEADVQIDSRINPEILGGIVVNVRGHVFDGSLQNQLQRLRKKLVENTNSKLN